MSCLILAACANYLDHVSKPFVESLLNTGYDGDYKIFKWQHSPRNEWPVDTYRMHLYTKYLQGTSKKY